MKQIKYSDFTDENKLVEFFEKIFISKPFWCIHFKLDEDNEFWKMFVEQYKKENIKVLQHYYIYDENAFNSSKEMYNKFLNLHLSATMKEDKKTIVKAIISNCPINTKIEAISRNDLKRENNIYIMLGNKTVYDLKSIMIENYKFIDTFLLFPYIYIGRDLEYYEILINEEVKKLKKRMRERKQKNKKKIG